MMTIKDKEYYKAESHRWAKLRTQIVCAMLLLQTITACAQVVIMAHIFGRL